LLAELSSAGQRAKSKSKIKQKSKKHAVCGVPACAAGMIIKN
jgi:hypothetical protein